MNLDYDWDISRQATERIIHLPKRKRDQLIAMFDELASGLEGLAESQFKDGNGAIHYIATHGITVVTYSIDHPVKLVHIVAVE